MAEQDERLGQLTAEKNSLENTHPMAAKLLQDGKESSLLVSTKWRHPLKRTKNQTIYRKRTR